MSLPDIGLESIKSLFGRKGLPFVEILLPFVVKHVVQVGFEAGDRSLLHLRRFQRNENEPVERRGFGDERIVAKAIFCQVADAMNPMRKEKIMAGTETNGSARGNSTNFAKTGRRKTNK
jgi:hypothetical protein